MRNWIVLLTSLFVLWGCSSSPATVKASAEKVYHDDKSEYFMLLARHAGGYYASAVHNYIANAKDFKESRGAYLKKISDEILPAFPASYHKGLLLGLASTESKSIDIFNNEMSRIGEESEGRLTVQEILKQNEYQKRKEFEKKQTTYRAFASPSLSLE